MVFPLSFDKTKETATTNKCTSVAGHFDSHGGATVQCEVHLLCIAPAATRVTANKTTIQNVSTLLTISMAVAVRWYYTMRFT